MGCACIRFLGGDDGLGVLFFTMEFEDELLFDLNQCLFFSVMV